MRTKYEQKDIAIYKNKIFTAYTTKDGFVRLRSYDVNDVALYGFELSKMSNCEIKALKNVSPYEVSEYYEQRFKAKYRGVPVSIILGDDENVEISANGTYEEMIKLGFKVVDKFEYAQSVSTKKLTDITCIKEDLLEDAKEEYDEVHSEK